ncbi:FecCD family ABC transporter permease [Chamaesiphon minutus]|uniref:ABC-type Fe3+-siderophore transport system, permease component n=1 Tax=Chamaesiphon minutus (strain ATCC 27169 / PCC 6605) TaxID=1173020 RepID=K9UFR2_CHAP6|nr:iron ABC transporter permease [Chamaesiphon minutus]AFY93660.1 ABC-type Fe3+-siderophore transport system, permease component [Chamaesiphon minutus PCC 6605]
MLDPTVARLSKYLKPSPLFGLGLGVLVAIGCALYSITLGTRDISLAVIFDSFTQFDNSFEHLIIQTVRLPRSLMAMAVGAALAVSGAAIQGLTRNPLAETGILGIEAGGALAVVGTSYLFGSTPSDYAGAAFVGAGIAAIFVYIFASLGPGGVTPLNLTIAGAAIAAFIAAVTTSILIVSQSSLEELRFWLAGSLVGRDFNLFLQVLPLLIVGLILAFALSSQIATLSLGEDVATSLGQNTLTIKLLTVTSVVLLAGSAVAIAGPIGFVGLVVPHGVRFFIKTDYRWILPYSAVYGAILLLVADIAARLLIQPQELPVGVMTALVGAPVFVYLAKTKIRA